MKIKSIPVFLFTATLASVIFYNCGGGNSTKNETATEATPFQQTSLPQDVLQSCVVDNATLASWFVDGQITENGQVKAANSVLFNPQNNCSFYTWSEQMFLWLTSKDGSVTVFESPDFYTVSPVTNNARHLIPHKKGDVLRATSNLAKLDTEEGQATDNVLLDRYGNVVYFITMVNDVYAAMVQMAAQYPDSITQFPTTQQQLDSILYYAKNNNIPISNPNVLAMELKTSWVKLNGSMKEKDYITIEAIIPEYDKKSESLWVLKGETKAKLALVGMHIVGSANGHPEMIWSTFEHRSNTPNGSYQYINTKGDTVTVPADNSGQWLFNQNAQNTNIADANISFAQFNQDTISADTNKGNQIIQPSNTIRVLPWGCAYDVQPNQEDASPAAANSEVIAINNSIINNLKGNDVRKNYIFIGSTWTFGGAVPNGNVYNPTVAGSTTPGAAIGTSSLANSTMETDFQLTPTPNIKGVSASNTCFTCHNSTLDPKIYPTQADGFIGLSHVFGQLMLGVPQNKQPKK